MFDNNTQDDSDSEELFSSSSDSSDEAADAAQSTDTQEDESDEKDLIPDEQDEGVQDDASDQANIERDKQAKNWATKIKAGEATLEDMPSNLHWLKPYVTKLLPVSKKKEKEVVVPDEKVEQIVDKKFKEKEEKVRFQSFKSSINKIKLTKTQKDGITSEFDILTKAGLSKSMALEKAAKMYGVDLDDGDTLFYQQAFAIPSSTGREMKEDKSESQVKGKTSRERVASLEQIRKGGV